MPSLRLCLLLSFLLASCNPQAGVQAPVLNPSPAVSPSPSPFQSSTPAPVATLNSTASSTDLQTPTHTPKSPTVAPSETVPPSLTTLLFTGVIVPARCVQAAIDARGDADYPYDEAREMIQQADLSIGVLNATLSDYPPHTGCVVTYVLVGDSRSAAALERAGFDLMSVATNHIKNCGIGDCGDRAFLETLENLRREGVQPVGAGMDLEEALQPVVFDIQGVRFGFVSLGMVEPMTFAGEDTPGIANLDETNLRRAIRQARQVSDVVIALPHWGPEDSPDPNDWQLDFARVAVEAGVDLVVGNHTHVVQAIEEVEGKPVFYGLGNFVFDQDWARDHQQGVILRVAFEGARYLGYELIPTHVDGDGTVHIAGEEEAAEVLERIRVASEKIGGK